MVETSPEMTPFAAFEVRMTRKLAERVHETDVELNRLHGEAIKGGHQNNSGSIKPQLDAVARCAEGSIQIVLGEGRVLTDPHRARAWHMWLEDTAERARRVLAGHVEALHALRWRINPAVLSGASPMIEDSLKRTMAMAHGEVDDFARGVWLPSPAKAVPKGEISTAQSIYSVGGASEGERAHVFISYVRENTAVAEWLVAVLRANGVEVFWDRDIPAGRRWLDVIREAIETGAYFVPLFSRQWEAREKTVANEELLHAREQLRRMPRDRAWFVGIRVDDCAVPAEPIGAGETLRDLHYLDIPVLGWAAGLEGLLRAVGVTDPKLPDGDPIGPGLAGRVKVTGGAITFIDVTTSAGPMDAFNVFRGMRFFVTGGVVGRAPDGTLAAYVKTDAPNANLQALNVQLGLHAAVARSAEKYVSDDPAKPTVFRFARRYEIRAGDLGFNAATGSFEKIPFDISALISYEVVGALAAGRFAGKFGAAMDFGPLKVFLVGECELRFEPDHGPPADFAQLEATLGQRVTTI